MSVEYLHILPAKTGEISDFLWGMERHCDMSEHRFLVTISKNGIIKSVPELLAFPYIECVETPKGRVVGKIRKFLWIWKRLHQPDRLIWHSLQMADGRYARFLWLSKKLREKSVWIPSGSDAVNWKQTGKGLKKKFNDYVQRKVRDEIPVVCAVFGSDVEFLRERWPEKTVLETPYPLSGEFMELLEQRKAFFENREVKPTAKNIQVGMNSSRFSRHATVLQHMKTQAQGPRNLFLPMNYTMTGYDIDSGAAAYRSSTVGEAKKVWNSSRVQVLQKTVSPEAYANYLAQLDVAVLGNEMVLSAPYFLYLLAAGVKLYMPVKSKVYGYLKAQGVQVYGAKLIEEMPLGQFVHKTGREGPSESMLWYYDRAAVMERWNALFEYLKENE